MYFKYVKNIKLTQLQFRLSFKEYAEFRIKYIFGIFEKK